MYVCVCGSTTTTTTITTDLSMHSSIYKYSYHALDTIKLYSNTKQKKISSKALPVLVFVVCCQDMFYLFFLFP